MDYIRLLFTLIHHLTHLLFSHSLVAATINHIRSLLAFIRRQPQPQTARPPSLSLENSPLALLPPEIIQHIASLLPPSAVAAFASTCLPVRCTIGTRQYLRALRASRTETLALLELLLVADLPTDPNTGLPSSVLCAHCARLVPIGNGSCCTPAALVPIDDGSCSTPACVQAAFWTRIFYTAPAASYRQATPACVQACALAREHIQAEFWPAIFHTAMAMHRRGRSAEALLARLTPSTTTVYNTTAAHGRVADTTTQRSWKYRIVDGSLYLRVREVTILSCENPDSYVKSWRPCAHYSCYHVDMSVEAYWVLNDVRDGERKKGSSSSGVIQCPYCRTVVLLGARTFRGRGIGLFIAWWKDLGDGRADEEWANQLRRLPDDPWEWKIISNNVGRGLGLDIVDGFDGDVPFYNRCFFDFDGEQAPADRRELFRLSKYVIGSRK